jgi:hypothetical protein
MIKLEDLKQGAWYYGDGRLGPVAQWNGNFFHAINYSWGQYQIDSMEYGSKGFYPYAIIDASFTPEVLEAVNYIMDMDVGIQPPPVAPTITSLQDLSVIQQFLIKFMEVGTYLKNVETQIATSEGTTVEEIRSFAREALTKWNRLR